MKVKDIQVKRIDSKSANTFIRRYHYSGKVVPNSQLHFGCFVRDKMLGVISFGPSLDKSKLMGLVNNTQQNQFVELNRMAFSDLLPKNSESRCLAVAIKLIKKYAPHIKWVVSFADGTQCGHGTMYQASNFILSGIKKNQNTCLLPSGDVIHKMTLESGPTRKRNELGGISYYELTGGKYNFDKYITAVRGKKLKGFQFRYIYILDSGITPKDFNFEPIPYSYIKENNIGMYKGDKLASVA